MRRLKVSILPTRHKFVTPISQHFIRTLRQFPASGCSDFNNMGLLLIDGAVVIQFSHRNFFPRYFVYPSIVLEGNVSHITSIQMVLKSSTDLLKHRKFIPESILKLLETTHLNMVETPSCHEQKSQTSKL